MSGMVTWLSRSCKLQTSSWFSVHLIICHILCAIFSGEVRDTCKALAETFNVSTAHNPDAKQVMHQNMHSLCWLQSNQFACRVWQLKNFVLIYCNKINRYKNKITYFGLSRPQTIRKFLTSWPADKFYHIFASSFCQRTHQTPNIRYLHTRLAWLFLPVTCNSSHGNPAYSRCPFSSGVCKSVHKHLWSTQFDKTNIHWP